MQTNPLQATGKTNACSQSRLRTNRFKLASKSAGLAVCMLLLLSCFSSTRLVQPVRGARTRYVPLEYPTIQQAINNASNQDTIQVSPGLYQEHVVVPDTINELTILGNPANPATTIVDGTFTGSLFRLDGTKVTLKGFTLRNGGSGYSAIESTRDTSTPDNHVISNNIIETSQTGILLSLSDNNQVTNNTFTNNPVSGISLSDSDSNSISQNKIQQSAYGIKLTLSISNTIESNSISEADYGIHISSTSTGNTIRYNNVSGQTAGIFINSDSNTVHHNALIDCDYGLWIYGSKYIQTYYNKMTGSSYGILLQQISGIATFHNISYNKIFENTWGIEVRSSNNNTFTGNWLQENTWGVSISGAAYNTLYRNNFMSNNISATANAINYWDKNSQGNHWSDYDGVDANNNGIGDTPYRITPGQDNYPLMRTWSQHDIAVQSITRSANEALQGTIVKINVTVRNNANISATENFQVTAKYNSSTIGTQAVTNLGQGVPRILTFNWDTTTVPIGKYVISAEATIVTDELNTDNNNLSDGTVRIFEGGDLLGDINNDGNVNSQDLILLNQAYGSTGGPPPSANWNPEADLNGDNIINSRDLELLGENYGNSI